jgi:uncharacterized membrane protein YgdD (TMEM256/DUF423 family)
VTPQRVSAFAASICAISVALGAYASHVAMAQDRQRLALSALFAFAHGLALIVVASRSSMLAAAGRLCFMVGIVLFSGSLAAAAFFSTGTMAAPFGGSLLILGWLLLALDFWRRP